MMVKLVLYHAGKKENEYQLSEFPIVIGRSEEADICITDRWMSRFHCELRMESGFIRVRDLGSTHGTMIDDRHILEAQLIPGCPLSIGLSSFVAEYEAPLGVVPDTELQPS